MNTNDKEPTLFNMFMYRLGWVRVKHYNDLAGRYERLYRRYVGKRMEVDRMVERLRKGGAV